MLIFFFILCKVDYHLALFPCQLDELRCATPIVFNIAYNDAALVHHILVAERDSKALWNALNAFRYKVGKLYSFFLLTGI